MESSQDPEQLPWQERYKQTLAREKQEWLELSLYQKIKLVFSILFTIVMFIGMFYAIFHSYLSDVTGSGGM